MTENVKHVDALAWVSRQMELARAVIKRSMEEGRMTDHFAAHQALKHLTTAHSALQREAAGDGEGDWIEALREASAVAMADGRVSISSALDDIAAHLTAPRPTGTDETTFGHGLTKEPLAITTPASAEPGEGGYVMLPARLTAENGAKGLLSGEFCEHFEFKCYECDDGMIDDEPCDDCDGRGSHRVKVPVEWTTIKAIHRMVVENLAKPVPDARGGGEAVAWRLVGTDKRPIEEQYEVGVMPKVPKPIQWETLYRWEATIAGITKDGKPPKAHPTPAALDADAKDAARYRWLRQFDIGIDHQGYDDYRWYAYAKPEPKHGRFGLDAAIDAARATTGARHE